MNQAIESAITQLESLQRIARALHRDIETVLKDLKEIPQQPSNVEILRRQAEEARVNSVNTLESLSPAPNRPIPRSIPKPIAEAAQHLVTELEERAPKLPDTPTEVLTRYLSPSVISGGRGFVQPGASGLKRYQEDLFLYANDLSELMDFPNGFYNAESDLHRQFFIKTPTFMVIVNGLYNGQTASLPYVSVILANDPACSMALEQMTYGERVKLAEELDVALSMLPQ